MRSYFFLNLYAKVQPVKRDIIVTAVIYYYITTEFYYAKRDSRFSVQHMEVLALRSVIFITKISKISKFQLKCLLRFSPYTTPPHAERRESLFA